MCESSLFSKISNIITYSTTLKSPRHRGSGSYVFDFAAGGNETFYFKKLLKSARAERGGIVTLVMVRLFIINHKECLNSASWTLCSCRGVIGFGIIRISVFIQAERDSKIGWGRKLHLSTMRFVNQQSDRIEVTVKPTSVVAVLCKTNVFP